MQEFIARENIRRFEAQLATCDDEKQRAVLHRLLQEERERVQSVKTAKADKPEG